MMAPSTRSARPALSAWRCIPGPPRDVVRARLLRLYRELLRRFGPQGWWPGRSPFEIAAGAILTQHTAWSQAARAVAALRARGLLAARALATAPDRVLLEAIRPAGTYRLKAKRLRDFAAWLLVRFGGRVFGMRRAPLRPLRRELLPLPRPRPQTGDAIPLYSARRPGFAPRTHARRPPARPAAPPTTPITPRSRATDRRCGQRHPAPRAPAHARPSL